MDGRKGGNEALRAVLRYLKDSRAENAVDAATRELHGCVEKVKIRPEVIRWRLSENKMEFWVSDVDFFLKLAHNNMMTERRKRKLFRVCRCCISGRKGRGSGRM